MNKHIHRCALLTLAALITGCGNSADDQPLEDKGPVLDTAPLFGEYDNAIKVDLAALVGLDGNDLLLALEAQLNTSLAAATSISTVSSSPSFKITPKWGFFDSNNGNDKINLAVVDKNGIAVLQTLLDAEAIGIPGKNNLVKNGFSMLIDLPNGLTTNAVMSYQFNLQHPLGYGSPDKSPDYIFLPGLTSGAPSVGNKASEPGEGFTFKYSTDRYGYLNTRYMDPTDNTFFNKKLTFANSNGKVKAQTWIEVQQALQTNEFLPGGSIPTSNGKLTTQYNREQVTTDAGLTENRIIVDGQHAYKLQGLFETYRHYKHNNDATAALKAQTISFKDITFAWDNAELVLPKKATLPAKSTLCSASSHHVKYVDLAVLNAAGATSGQTLLDGIAQQLGGLPAGSVTFDWGVNSMAIVAEPGQTDRFMLQVDYAAGATAGAKGNGAGFKITYPTTAQVTGTCLAFNLNITTPINTNADYIYLPSVQFTDGANTLTDHRYSTNKYKRFAAKFVHSPHSDLNWLDYSGNNYVNDSTWYAIQQVMNMDNTGLGYIDFVVNNASYFKQTAAKFSGTPFADVLHQVVPADKLADMQVMANFDSYRHATGGVNAQTIYYKDITIGWNEITD